MTLCTAWIREVNDKEELVFATDSVLTGGEKWESGIKLFELPRKDCLLCFTGSTARAYPLILNLVSSITLEKIMEHPSASITDILNYITELFTTLSKKIVKEIPEDDIHEMRAQAKFLFGGWCWQTGRFRIWKIDYSKESEGFLFSELTQDDGKTRFYTFLGEATGVNVEKEASDKLKKLLFDEDKIDSKLDMEPLSILRDISLDSQIREVSGSLQIAKVYKSSKSEFFGVMWPSVEGKAHFQGREYSQFNRPDVKYYDPYTWEFYDINLPAYISELSYKTLGANFEFVCECYNNQDGSLRDDLNESDKLKLQSILRDMAYNIFLKDEEEKHRMLLDLIKEDSKNSRFATDVEHDDDLF